MFSQHHKTATRKNNPKTQSLGVNMGSNQQVRAALNTQPVPEDLKHGAEQLGGMDLSDVQVHYNSDRPRRHDAMAFAQGNQIHLGKGQEDYLPHELWHVVQHKQGRAGGNEHSLEQEANVMGRKAERMTPSPHGRPLATGMTSHTMQYASPLADAVSTVKASSNSTGASLISETLVTGIRQAEDMFLMVNPLNRWGEALGQAGSVGPGQIGKDEIGVVDRGFATAAAAFAATHGAAPTGWKEKATDDKWHYFYIAGYLAHCINVAEDKFHPATPVMSNSDLGVLELGIAIYHGAWTMIKAMRRRIAGEKGISVVDVSWEMVKEELRSGTATPDELQLEQYTQLAQGEWSFDFDIQARLRFSRRFEIQNGKLEVECLANYADPTATTERGSHYRITLHKYEVASSFGFAAEGTNTHGSHEYQVGVQEKYQWTGLRRGDYALRIEKVEDSFSDDHLMGEGTVRTQF